jgi:hypothetical protein
MHETPTYIEFRELSDHRIAGAATWKSPAIDNNPAPHHQHVHLQPEEVVYYILIHMMLRRLPTTHLTCCAESGRTLLHLNEQDPIG